MPFRKTAILLAVLLICVPFSPKLHAQEAAAATPREKVIVDTDIGDDVDDAFALALAVSSPRLQILGVTTAWGDTDLRARLVARFLSQTGHSEIPVAEGPRTHSTSAFSQARWAEAWPRPAGPKRGRVPLEDIPTPSISSATRSTVTPERSR